LNDVSHRLGLYRVSHEQQGAETGDALGKRVQLGAFHSRGMKGQEDERIDQEAVYEVDDQIEDMIARNIQTPS